MYAGSGLRGAAPLHFEAPPSRVPNEGRELRNPFLNFLESLGSTDLYEPTGLRRLLRLVPPLPRFAKRRYAPTEGKWPDFRTTRPEMVAGRPGIERDKAAEEEAFASVGPLPMFERHYRDAMIWLRGHIWRARLKALPGWMRAVKRARRVSETNPTALGSSPEPEQLTDALRQRAAELGLSAIGVAEYDPKYTFAPYQDQQVGDRVITCILEQSWEATQTIPSALAEKAALETYKRVINLGSQLGQFLVDMGYRTTVCDQAGHHVAIHYGVEAGLGQLGLNGQLLTPHAGSRCRLITITTNAPLSLDSPIDFGINAICDKCQACVERCPSGAIPSTRQMHRGVLKAKINTKRCLPVVARAEGCALCMKVCPVQRYGLSAVYEELAATGTIIGRHSDELEGYEFIDGEYYGPGERPKLDREFFSVPDEQLKRFSS